MATITGAHSIIYSRYPDADRALLRDVFKLPNSDSSVLRPEPRPHQPGDPLGGRWVEVRQHDEIVAAG